MRLSGTVDAASGCGAHDHVCWAFDTDVQFARCAAQFLADGLALGQRVQCIVSSDPAPVEAELARIPGFAQALRTGAAGIVRLDTVYPPGMVVVPEAQVETYRAATAAALADGFTGLRVAAEATELVRTPEQLDEFARYEHLVDRYMAEEPFAALCGYSRPVLGRDGVAAIAAMHPAISRDAAPMRLFPSPEAHVSARLAGEVDLAGHWLLEAALRRADLPQRDGKIVLDAAELSFIDHRGLGTLAAYSRARGVPTVVRARPGSVVALLCELVDFPGVRVVTA